MEIDMLQVAPRKSKSRAKINKASWSVDLRYALAGGKQRYFSTREEAQHYIDELNKETSKQNKSSEAWKWTWAQLAEAFVEHIKQEYRDCERTESYVNEKIRHIDCVLDCVVDGKQIADMRVADLTKGMVAHQVMNQIKINRTVKTVKNICISMSVLTKFGILEGCRESNVWVQIEFKGGKSSKGRDKAPLIQKEIIDNIIANMCPRWQLITKFAANTGVRQGEQRALTWGQVNLEKGRIEIDRAIKHKTVTADDPKTKAGKRIIPLTHELKAALKELYIKQGRPNDPTRLVFGTEFNRPITSAKYLKRITEACRRAGVGPIRWHDLRHFYASTIMKVYNINDVEDMRKVKQYMGHSNIRITDDIYGHWLADEDDYDEDADKLSAAF